MSCDVVKRWKGWRMSCDIGEVTERLENELCCVCVCVCVCELCSFSNLSVTSPTSQLILQPFHRFTYITAHSPTLLLLQLRHSSFSNPSFASPASQAHSPRLPSLYLLDSSFPNPSEDSPTSQLILQPFFRFSYITGSSLTSPGGPPMVYKSRNYDHYALKNSYISIKIFDFVL